MLITFFEATKRPRPPTPGSAQRAQSELLVWLATAVAGCTFEAPFTPRMGGNELQCGPDLDVARFKIVERLPDQHRDHTMLVFGIELNGHDEQFTQGSHMFHSETLRDATIARIKDRQDLLGDQAGCLIPASKGALTSGYGFPLVSVLFRLWVVYHGPATAQTAPRRPHTSAASRSLFAARPHPASASVFDFADRSMRTWRSMVINGVHRGKCGVAITEGRHRSLSLLYRGMRVAVAPTTVCSHW